MRKKFCLLFTFVAMSLLCCGILTACGEKRTDDAKTVVTYYLYNDTTPITAVVFDGSFSFDIVPQKKHYKFLGLFDDKTGGTQILDEYGRCNTVIESSITLWAHWQGNDCNITFDAGKGILPNETSSMSVVYGSAAPNFPVPQRTGFDFVGWMSGEELVSDGATPIKGTFDDSNYTFEPDSDSVVLVAKYEVAQLTLTLDYNDNGAHRTETRTVRYGDTLASVDLPRLDTGESELVGWSKVSDADIPFTGTFSSDITLYAVWRGYKIFRFYTDDEEYKEHKLYQGEEYQIPNAGKVGYDLVGWYSSPMYSGSPVQKVSYSSAKTSYYAKWEAIRYRITFDIGNATLGEMTYTIEQDVLLPDAGSKPYSVFVGWCKNSDFSDTPMEVLPRGTYGNITLYAKWKGEDRVVHLDPAEGNVTPDRATIEYGTVFDLAVPVREGYVFLGWFTDENVQMTNGNGVGLDKFGITEPEITLYAHWKIKTYTVEYRTNGGSAVSDQVYEHGATLNFPASPTKPDMELEGWYLDELFSTPVEEGMQVVRDMVLYAKWYQMSAIHSAEELKTVAEHPDWNYYLASDINLDSESWSPIENFSGVFDGRGRKIFNFTISVSSTAENLGFFAANSGTIKNLTLEGLIYNYIADGDTSAGVFVGLNTGTISNCVLSKSTITLHGEYRNSTKAFRFGCFAGENQGTVENCKSEASNSCTGIFSLSVNERDKHDCDFYFGGTVGVNRKTVVDCESAMSPECTVGASNNYSWVYDTTSVARFYGGGIAGYQAQEGEITRSQAQLSMKVNIGNCGGSESHDAYTYVGGLVGLSEGSVEICKAICGLDVAAFRSGYVGGLIGHLKVTGTIANCYAAPTIETSRSDGDQTAGGFVGVNEGTIRNCYSSGSILSQKGATGGFVGNNQSTGTVSRCFSLTKLECDGDNVGKFNRNNAGTISNCYYADTVSGEGNYFQDGIGIAEKIESELLSAEFLTDEFYWNSNYWQFDAEGATAPKLLWEV